MNLPNDYARCHGLTAYAICEKRETCRRTEPVTSKFASYLFPQIPGPCSFFLPKREAPSERSEEVPPPESFPTPTPGVSP